MSNLVRGGRWRSFSSPSHRDGQSTGYPSSSRGHGRGSVRGGRGRGFKRGTPRGRGQSQSRSRGRSHGNEARNAPESEEIICCLIDRKDLFISSFNVTSSQIFFSKVPVEDENFLCIIRVIDSHENPTIVLPSNYRFKEKFISTVSNALGEPRPSVPIKRTSSRSGCTGSQHNDNGNGENIDNASVAMNGANQVRSVRQRVSNSSAPSVSRSHSQTENEEEVESFSNSHSRTTSRNENEHAEKLSSIFFLPSGTFSLSRAETFCSLVHFSGMPPGLSPRERIAYLTHIFNDESGYMKVLGALLCFLSQHGSLGNLHQNTNDDTIHISTIQFRNYSDTMQLSPTTLRCLHIFNDEIHPLGHGSLKGKEGHSIYSLFYTQIKTQTARHLFRAWLSYPSNNLQVIQQRQFMVNLLLDPSNKALLTSIQYSLRGIADVRTKLIKLRTKTTQINDWKSLYNTSKSFISIKDNVKEFLRQNEQVKEQNKLLTDIDAINDEEIREVINWIYSVVDFEESNKYQRLIVCEGFSQEIDELKEHYLRLDEFLTKVGKEEYDNLIQMDQCPNINWLRVTFVKQIGFLIVLPKVNAQLLNLSLWESNFDLKYQFQLNDKFHFKNNRCLQLDQDIGDIHAKILELERHAFLYLTKNVLNYEATLCNMMDLITNLDCLQAMSKVAIDHSFVIPEISDDSNALFKIEDGTHPLLKHNVNSVIPNSTNMKIGDIHVLTGPNFSGKSVYMNQVGIIAILAQIGSAVPAKRAKIPLMRGINVRMGSFESVIHNQSSFFMDSWQVASMLRPDSRRMLNIIDEYGKGTSITAGMSLLKAVLTHLYSTSVENECMSICTTHFTDLLTSQYLPVDSDRFGLFNMEVLDPIGSNDDNAEDWKAVRTYKLVAGTVCAESMAIQCALEQGVPKRTLRNVAHVTSAIRANRHLHGQLRTDPQTNLILREVDRINATQQPSRELQDAT